MATTHNQEILREIRGTPRRITGRLHLNLGKEETCPTKVDMVAAVVTAWRRCGSSGVAAALGCMSRERVADGGNDA